MEESQQKWIAVAGATGKAGKEILRAASMKGLKVRALVRNEERLGAARDFCDDVRIVQVTQADTLVGCLDGVDYLYTALGKTLQQDNVTRFEVDVVANSNLFNEAKRAGVKMIGMISVFMASIDHPVAMIQMKGRAEKILKETGIPCVIIQPSGFFSDMWEIFEMVKSTGGTYFSIGPGDYLFNPIGLDDLGNFAIEKLLVFAKDVESLGDDAGEDQKVHTFPIGGPDVFPVVEVARMAGRVLGIDVTIRVVPLWLCKMATSGVSLFSQNMYELGNFFVGNAEYAELHLNNDCTVPKTGFSHLEDYFKERYSHQV